uniref:F-box domain-containing protein n=1 Tax=Ditylenchus dipsaci TaxID=166011 RepID=A0A915D7L6_9BILA
MRGFQSLIEHEWIAAGHPFTLRCAHSAYATGSLTGPYESPVFLCFLDCVWQIMRQYPCCFEFTEEFLIFLFEHAYASEFGSYLGNNEFEKTKYRVKEGTVSLWSYVNHPEVLPMLLHKALFCGKEYWKIREKELQSKIIQLQKPSITSPTTLSKKVATLNNEKKLEEPLGNLKMDQTSINSLSLEILVRIFEHLNYRHRVRVERVCTYWKLAGKLHAWKRVTRLKFTRKMLCLKEPWKDWKRNKLVVELSQAAIAKKEKLKHTWSVYSLALRNPDIYKHTRPSRTLGAFSAIIQRCGPYLEELHLRDIGVDTRFGRFFRFMPHIKHLRIDSPLDKWHLELVDRFYSSQLISLAISYINGVDYHMFEQILRKATKLECLRVGNMSSLFDYDEQEV